jgi:hypothetical protein
MIGEITNKIEVIIIKNVTMIVIDGMIGTMDEAITDLITY